MAELSAREQLMLEMVNRARLDPAAEAARLGIALNAGLAAGQITAAAKQPLAANELLKDSALAHSDWMIANDVFSHTGVGGSNPGDRMAAAGYIFSGSWTWGENIAWSGTTGTPDGDAYTLTLADNLFRSAGHRLNILNGDFREIGTGIATGQLRSGAVTYNAVMGTQNFAASGSSFFVTGVAINDADHDNFYDIGEARREVTVNVAIGGVLAGSDLTASSGGYAVAVSGGTADVTFSGGSLPSDVIVTVAMGSGNAKVDLIDDHKVASSATTILGLSAFDLILLGVASIDGTGNADANALFGNRGANTLSGLEGSDVLTGGGGRDVLLGGAGQDVFDFNVRGDSGNTAALRDVIADFVHGEDIMDLLGVDANLRAGGNQAFSWRGAAAFNGHAGQLRFVKSDVAGTVNDKTVVYGDLNGDRKPDFQIELTGLHNLTSADFIL
jgi:Ca2+-binding RTX toxin-like protein